MVVVLIGLLMIFHPLAGGIWGHVREWKAFMGKYLPNGDPADFGHSYGYSVAALMESCSGAPATS